MSRFATIHTEDLDPNLVDRNYVAGFSYSTKTYSHISKPGLSEGVVREISHIKEEPEWMLEKRLLALTQFNARPVPQWGGDLNEIIYDKIHYYLRATDKQATSWSDVPQDVQDTFEKLGVPKAEREVLAGVKMQYDCLTAEAMVFCPTGIKKIINICPNDFVYSLNEKTKLLEKQKVIGVVAKGSRNIFNVVTQGGREIKVTENHPFLNLNYSKPLGKQRGRFSEEWKYLSELKKGDLIAITTNFPDEECVCKDIPLIVKKNTIVKSHNQYGEHDLNVSNWYSDVTFPEKVNEDLMWLFGFFLGDGYFGSKNENGSYTRVELAIPKQEAQLRGEVSELIKKQFGYELLTKHEDKVLLNSILFPQFFESLGLKGNAHSKRIPEWVFGMSKEMKLEFLAGYFDADGGIRKAHNNDLVLTSCSHELLYDFKMLALSCGLNVSHVWEFVSKMKYKEAAMERLAYRLSISGNIMAVPSRVERKRSRFKEKKYIQRFTSIKGTVFGSHASDHIGFVKILSIDFAGEEKVYDIEVEGFHNFVANGIVVHNSEVVYGSLKNVWEKEGVIFLSMDEALKQYPDLIKEYFGTLIPSNDNKFSALNTAVWSGGSFVYVPKGVDVKMPLQAYFRINAANAGQFERTLIIVDEGANVHYVEGCFVAGTSIETIAGIANIQNIEKGEFVRTHNGTYKEVYHTQVRPYSGNLYEIEIVGNPKNPIETTEEHPFLVVKRQRGNERNRSWNPEWIKTCDIKTLDYLCVPIDKSLVVQDFLDYWVSVWQGKKNGFELEKTAIPSTSDFFRLAGYYLAEGSISSGHYLQFSFNSDEREYIEDVKRLVEKVFGETHISESVHKKNHGTSVVISSTKLCRIFEQFGTSCYTKNIPQWMLQESCEKQVELIKGWYFGDGNYYHKQHKHGWKEVFRINTTSKVLAFQARQLLARLGVAASLNCPDRSDEGGQEMYVLVVGGEYLRSFGNLVGVEVSILMNGKKRATFYHIDGNYLYVPIRRITKRKVDNLPVYNFSVREDESYVAGGVAVHNCTAPSFSSSSLHSAVVEIFVKKGARCQYTTVQNWYKNIYNLVTKRAHVAEEATMIWTDFNMGSKLTMKYPGFILAGKGAKGETLSMAMAGQGQHQDTGSKAIHLAPYTSSTIVSKSISKNGGRTSYRGLVQVGPQAHHSKNTVICDALILDSLSRSDTYPIDRILNNQVEIQHEATVSRIGDEQLFYLMSRGISEADARKMIVNGFVDDLIRKLPLEYAVEMNRLIDHEMEGSVG